ncbi:putative ribonuclease H-like domain-containing protein [Tanacetum coccineum]|uniref:Ribonuclease H-like domain-containing protein n=1 Tax=Tanacetum coccineum TaxID=301880 RepID=A0ABQ4WBZ6_9ASTR
MDDPNIIMEEYIELEVEKVRRHENDNDEVNISTDDVVIEQSDSDIDANVDTQPHEFDEGSVLIPILRYEGQEYTNAVVHDYEDMLSTIFGKQVNRVHVLDFDGLSDETRQPLTDTLRMVYIGAKGQVLFTSDAWRRVFEIMGPLVLELMLEFFSTRRISDIVLELDVADTRCFQLGGLRRQLSWRIAFDGDFLGAVPSYTSIRDPLRRLCHRLIAYSISGRGHAPEKVTATELFYLRSMDEGTAVNVTYLLAQYLFRYAEGRKQGARMSGRHFVARLAKHFRLLTEERLRGFTVVVRDLTVIDMDELARIEKLEEEVYGLRESFGEQRAIVDAISGDFSRFTTWAVGRLGHLLHTTGGASTSAAPHTND